MRVSGVILALGNMTLPQCNKSHHCTLQQSILFTAAVVTEVVRASLAAAAGGARRAVRSRYRWCGSYSQVAACWAWRSVPTGDWVDTCVRRSRRCYRPTPRARPLRRRSLCPNATRRPAPSVPRRKTVDINNRLNVSNQIKSIYFRKRQTRK